MVLNFRRLPLRSIGTTLMACTLALALAACASPSGPRIAQIGADLDGHLGSLLSRQVLLIGEQHDAPEHQQWQQRIVQHLAERKQLAALVLEMAPRGGRTDGLPTTASEAQVRTALQWDERAWPWAAYGPAVMSAVRAGVPVRGGNLPAQDMRERMRDTALDARLPAPALQRQQQLIREGHCQFLPEGQIAPMTRIQIARDLNMAQTLEAALPDARAGQVVVLISGSVHADRQLGVPQHLPAHVQIASLRLQAGERRIAGESFDQVLTTPPVPPVDHCAGLAEQFRQRGKH